MDGLTLSYHLRIGRKEKFQPNSLIEQGVIAAKNYNKIKILRILDDLFFFFNICNDSIMYINKFFAVKKMSGSNAN